MQNHASNPSGRKAYVITGPTSGIGRATAFEVAKHGTVVLVGRGAEKLDQLQREIERKGAPAASVVCDLSDIASVRRAPTAPIKCPLCSELMLVIERFTGLQLLSAPLSAAPIKTRLDSS